MRVLTRRDSSKVLGVIPARFAAMRFPGKPLKKIMGRPMVQWVYEAALKALPRVIVATDDFRIRDAVKEFGGEVMLTPNTCTSGTDRMAYVAARVPAQYYVNIQGDEPMMNPETVKVAVDLAIKKKGISTAATTLRPEERDDKSAVKVIVGGNDQAIYFSRGMIPTMAHGVTESSPTYKHLGIYVYPKAALKQFVRWPQADLEKTEKLEQLRALHFGAPIYVALTRYDSIGVDTPADLAKVTALMKREKS
jgi:3-deoxy-manno-octulosonate cytidylyltransferase (CMP-KDO synthetase)